MSDVLVYSAGFVAVYVVAIWLASLWKRDASIVDVFWGPGFAGIACIAFAYGDAPFSRRALVTGLALLWGLRLGAHLLWRSWGRPEDFRYRAMRAQWGARFAWVSLFSVFLLQGALMWLVSLPLQLAQASSIPARLDVLALFGVAVFALGFCFETIGDLQLARFRSDPANAGAVLDTGLWRYTRHPNYFGDCVVWWALYLFALSTPYALPALLGPIAMTILLRRVSGVPMLERSLLKRRPGYAEYVARTSPFFPRRPR